MRVLLAPAGTRGDFQPMLALAVGLARAGHAPTLVTSDFFEPEARAFGIPFVAAGMDVRSEAREWGKSGGVTPGASVLRLMRLARATVGAGVEELVPIARGFDFVVAGGAQICAPSAAEAAKVPCWYFSYISQFLPSAYHAPVMMPIRGRQGLVNRALWKLSHRGFALAFGGPLAAARKRLGLPPLESLEAHYYRADRALLASDPELDPVPPDLGLAHAPFGSFHLPDERPLPDDLVKFLRDGPPPVYIGFGSCPDARPRETAALIVAAVERAGMRAVISRGWSELTTDRASPSVHFADDLSHTLLFPLVAAVVHHGGAGTTAASARAGKPQLIVHHVFDQIRIGERVHAAGAGPPTIARRNLDVHGLAAALRVLHDDEHMRERAARIGESISARDAVGDAVRFLEAQAR